MSRRSLVAAVLLAASVAGLQYGVLHRTREQVLERRASNFAELKASSLLPTYIGSLFLGSFRAIAIDVLWIQLTRMKQQEHRYFETVEIMDLISKLQPRNPEVWSMQAWDMAYNIANQFVTGEEASGIRRLEEMIRTGEASGERRALAEERIAYLRRLVKERETQRLTWIRSGLLKLVEGTKHLPEDAYLQFQMGLVLQQKSCPNDGVFDEAFLAMVEGDAELQRILGGDPAAPKDGLELAEAWFERSLRTLEILKRERRFKFYQGLLDRLQRTDRSQDDDYWTSQMGLNVHPLSVAGFRYQSRWREAMLAWRRWQARGRDLPAGEQIRQLEEVRRLLRVAAERSRDVLAYPFASQLFAIYPKMTADLELVLDAQVAALRAGTPLAPDALLARLEAARLPYADGAKDGDYVTKFLGEIKRGLGGDDAEWNDDLLGSTALYRPGKVFGTLAPHGRDVDCFELSAFGPEVQLPDGRSHHPGPYAAKFRIRRLAGGPLKVTVTARRGEKLEDIDRFDLVDDKVVEREGAGDRPGLLFVRVEAPEPGTSYEIEPLLRQN